MIIILNVIGIALAVLLFMALLLWLFLERSLLPRQSTREFFAVSNMTWRQKVEGYIYITRPDMYLKPAAWSWFVHRFEGVNADTYHGKVITNSNAAKLIQVNKAVNIEAPEKVIPYKMARSIILDGRPPVAVLDCPCRAQKKDACTPRDVCMVIGEPFVSFTLEHNTGNGRSLTTEEALKILQEEEERGHIHSAWFKNVMQDRFYVICNCCSCCCLGMKSYQRNVPRIAHSGYRPVMNSETCRECDTCVDICPFGAIIAHNGPPQIDDHICMGCGICVSHCPVLGIELTLAPERGIPLEIDQLAN